MRTSRFGAAIALIARLTFAFVVALAVPGCSTLIGQVRYNPADLRFALDKPSGPNLSQSAAQTLKARQIPEKLSFDQLAALNDAMSREVSAELVYAYAETSYLLARSIERSRSALAKQLYLSSAICSYHYMFNPALVRSRDESVFEGEYADARVLYNGACDRFLRLAINEAKTAKKAFPFKFGDFYFAQGESESFQIYCDVPITGSGWSPEEYAYFEVASSLAYNGLTYDCKRSGLGAPLAVARRPSPTRPRREEEYYPEDVCFPATALIRPNPAKPLGATPPINPNATPENELQATADVALEIFDSLASPNVVLEGREVPLETDYTTPLAYYLTASSEYVDEAARTGLLKPEALLEKFNRSDNTNERTLQGLYMMEPYDPNKIPVIMTHGLASSPVTWMEMYNALRNSETVRNGCQFLFFFYPTGQPFWASAATMREELRRFRETVDPNGETPALDQMILIGHSMGGLISRLQVQESGDRLWRLVSDKPFDETNFDAETRADLASWFFFEPNESVKCVVSIATPFEGSDFSNNFTQWIAGRAIQFPRTVARALSVLPGVSSGGRGVNLLQVTTSVEALSPKCPIFAALDKCPIPDSVELVNIVGVLPEIENRLLLSRKTDGIVDFWSATRNDALQIEVPASHTEAHAHPKAIIQVKETLAAHVAAFKESLAARAQGPKAPYSNAPYSVVAVPIDQPSRAAFDANAPQNEPSLPSAPLLGPQPIESQPIVAPQLDPAPTLDDLAPPLDVAPSPSKGYIPTAPIPVPIQNPPASRPARDPVVPPVVSPKI